MRFRLCSAGFLWLVIICSKMQKGKSTLKTAHIAHSTPGLIHSPFRRGNRCVRNANTQSKVDNFRWITPGSWVKGTSWHFRGFQRAGLKSRSAASVKTAFHCAPGFSKSKKVSLIKGSWWPAVSVEPADGCLCELRCVYARYIPVFWVPTECFKCPCKCWSSIF